VFVNSPSLTLALLRPDIPRLCGQQPLVRSFITIMCSQGDDSGELLTALLCAHSRPLNHQC